MSSYEYFETTFEDIYNLWDKGLWPNRVSKIMPMNTISWTAWYWEDFGKIEVTKDQNILKSPKKEKLNIYMLKKVAKLL